MFNVSKTGLRPTTILGPGTWAPKGGPPKLLVILLKSWGRRGSFLGPLFGPQNRGAFCVKNIAEAECATREHVSARKRACPKLLVVGRSLCSALVPKSWPSADRGGPSRGFGFCYRLWTSLWGAKWLKFLKAAGRLFSGCWLKGARARTGWLVGWLVGWQVGLIGWLAGWPVRRMGWLLGWLVG